MLSIRFDLPPGRGLRLLFIGAHCDDIEIGCGGTLQKWLQQYPIQQVSWIVFTSTPVRKAEALASARQYLDGLPEKDIRVLDFRDAYLPHAGPELKEYFSSLATELDPDLIFTHHREDLHQDHRLLAELSWQHFREQLIFEYEIPKYEGDLGQPNCFVSLSEEQVTHKLKGLMRHFSSQHDKHWYDAETFRSMMRLRGLESASPSRYAEAFYVRKMRL